MLKVLLVDDEMLVRLGVKSCINFDKLGFKLIGEASNGQEALEIIERDLPDIILLDIRMPVMDGLQLLNILKDKKISTNVIILSCYNDFEYVKEALRLGAKDYILKLSFKPEDLNNLLAEIANKIYESHKNLQEDKVVNYQEVIPYIRNLLFVPGYNENAPSLFEDELKDSQFALIKLGYKSDFIESTDKALINIIKEITKEYGLCLIIREKNELLLFLSFDLKYTISDLKEIVDRIFNTIKSCLNKKIKISVGSICKYIHDIKKSYLDASKAFENLFYSKDNYILLWENSCELEDRKTIITKEMEKDILDSLELCDGERLHYTINTLFDSLIASKNVKHKTVISTSLAIVSILSKFQRDNNLLNDDILVNSYECIMHIDNIFDLKAWFNDLIRKYINFIIAKQTLLKRKDLKLAEEYINANYNKKVSLSEIARYINMSENYFSYLFKKEYNDTFINYQNKVKISKAKELLANGDYKINELSEKLGYTDPSYFCKVFKKLTGKSPENFKMSLLKNSSVKDNNAI